ncbi:MAG: patatin-like phospholipase family protein [Bacteroidota bacterium]|nr:patatin-like phospholipase family protein [Bacteroidota bacterium]
MKKNVSLVLSGGGARGTAHIGVIEELEKQGFKIHSIAGTSMGAFVGGVYATGKLKEFKEWITSLKKMDVFKLVDFTIGKQGFIKGNKVFEKLKEFVPDVHIEDLDINYLATATDLTNRKEILFTKGSIYDAIRASIAIPNILTPFLYKGSILVDGGVTDNIPVSHAKRIKNDILIAVDVNADIPLVEVKDKNREPQGYQKAFNKIQSQFNKTFSYKDKSDKNREKDKDEEQPIYQKGFKKIQSLLNKNFSLGNKNGLNSFGIMNESYEMMRDKLVSSALEKNPPDILIKIPAESCTIYDFYKAEKLIKIGQKATTKSLEDYKNK